MAAFDLVVNSLAQVMEQTGTLGSGHIGAQFGGQQAGDMGDFDGMVQHVLTVTGAVMHPAKQLDFLWVQAVDVGLQYSPFPFCLDDLFHLAFGLLHHLLDAGRVDAAVGDEPFQCDAGDFPTDGVIAGDGDGLRRVVDDQLCSGEGFQSADIAAFPTDDPALHLVIGQRNH